MLMSRIQCHGFRDFHQAQVKILLSSKNRSLSYSFSYPDTRKIGQENSSLRTLHIDGFNRFVSFTIVPIAKRVRDTRLGAVGQTLPIWSECRGPDFGPGLLRIAGRRSAREMEPAADDLIHCQHPAARRRQTLVPTGAKRQRCAKRYDCALGGFLGRKGNGKPGAKTLWPSLHDIAMVVDGMQAARQAERCV